MAFPSWRVLVPLVLAAGCDAPQEPAPVNMGTTEAEADDDDGEASDETAAGEDTSGSTGGAPATSGDPSTGTMELEYACEDVSECVLHSDCCSCTAVHVDEPIAACDMSCDRNACETWGISELLCAHACRIRLVECDPEMVTCTQAPPACDVGFSPGVDERCWSGYSIPTDLCRP